jgi:hypothetical protein
VPFCFPARALRSETAFIKLAENQDETNCADADTGLRGDRCDSSACGGSDAAQKPTFEVVSIRPCKPDELGGGMRPTPGGERYVANCAGEGLHEKWTAKSAPMTFFTWRLGLKLDRPVIDQTGLRSGGYDFDLSFTNEIPPGRATDFQGLDTSGPTISQAFRSQLGLALDARKSQVEVLVIDHIERPTEN